MKQWTARVALGLAMLILSASALRYESVGGVSARADEAPASAPTPTPAPEKNAPAATTLIKAPAWGQVDSLTRLLPIDSYAGPLNEPLTLQGARGEVVDKQLVLLAADKDWRGIHLSFSDLRGPKGATISGAKLQWRPVGSVRTRRPYYDTRYVGLWPDPLLPAAPFDVAAHGRATAWIDLLVPEKAAAGRYGGTITVSAAGAAPLRVPLTLHVWNFTLPRQSHLRTSFGNQGPGNYPLDYEALYSDELAHRITPINAVGDPRVVSAPGQPLKLDWTEWDRSAQRRLAQGMTSFAVHIGEPKAAWAKEWQTHLQAKGLLSYAYTYIADEPLPFLLEPLNAQMLEIKQAAPQLHNLMTARGFPDGLQFVDIWCPDIVYFDAAAARREQERGRAVWWYPAYPTQHPMINVWTDYPALDCRIWPWMTWKYDLDGMLYWTICNWQDNTTNPLQNAPAFIGGDGPANGDGQLVYPGPNGKPLDSIRWEAIRDGMQDYEVFCLLEAGTRELQAARKSPALVKQAQALLAIDPVLIASFKQYDPDPNALLATRERMSQTVEKIVVALGHQPAIRDRPRSRPGVSPAEIPGVAPIAASVNKPD